MGSSRLSAACYPSHESVSDSLMFGVRLCFMFVCSCLCWSLLGGARQLHEHHACYARIATRTKLCSVCVMLAPSHARVHLAYAAQQTGVLGC